MVHTRSGKTTEPLHTKKRVSYKPETTREQVNKTEENYSPIFDFNRNLLGFTNFSVKADSYITEMVNWRDSEETYDQLTLQRRIDELEKMWSKFKQVRKCEWIPSFRKVFIGNGHSNGSHFLDTYTSDFEQKDHACKALYHIAGHQVANGQMVGTRDFFYSALLPLEFKHPEGKRFILQVRLRELASFIFCGTYPIVPPQKFYYHVADLAKNQTVITSHHGQMKVKIVPDTFCFKFISLSPMEPIDISEE